MNNSSEITRAYRCAATICCNRGSSNYVMVIGYPILLFLVTAGSLLNTLAIFGVGRWRIREILIASMAMFDCLGM